MKLKDWIKAHGMSVPIMSRVLAVSENYLYRISSGAINPSYPLAKLIEAYTNGDVTVDELRPCDKLRCPTCGLVPKDQTILNNALKQEKPR
jgi:transcriptional regulator with XRE-family HTH domain